MRIFIAGATGVLGRRVVPRFVRAGHEVVGLARRPGNATALEAAGAVARPGDLFDAKAVLEATRGCDVILHLATAIPTKARTTRADWLANDCIRREGTAHLVAAARAHRVSRYVQESVAFLYGDRAGAWVDESTEIERPAPGILESAFDMERVVEEARAAGLPAVTLRFGSFYAHDSSQTLHMLEQLAKRRYPIVRDGAAFLNPVHVDDAASAVVAATLAEKVPSPLYNVCDDTPVRMRDLFTRLAEMVGGKIPLRVPAFVARLGAGSSVVNTVLASARCKNERMGRELDWRPRYPSYEQGYASVLEVLRRSNGRNGS